MLYWYNCLSASNELTFTPYQSVFPLLLQWDKQCNHFSIIPTTNDHIFGMFVIFVHWLLSHWYAIFHSKCRMGRYLCIISMAQCTTAISPLLTHLRYWGLALIIDIYGKVHETATESGFCSKYIKDWVCKCRFICALFLIDLPASLALFVF